MPELASTPDDHVSTSLIMNGRKPFPFLRLPAELRNRVYEFIQQDLETAADLAHAPLNCATTSDYIGLAGGSKQLRAEFFPLLMRGKILVWLRAYPKFIDAFLRSESLAPTLTEVRILVGFKEWRKTYNWDMLPALLARANNRGSRIKVDSLRLQLEEAFPDDRTGGIRAHDLAFSASYILSGSCRGLMRAIKSGYITAVHLKTKTRQLPEWCLTITKKSGGLRDMEIGKFDRIVDALQGDEKYPGYIVDITIKVVDLQGKHVEEWYAYRGQMLRNKVGRNWSELGRKEDLWRL